MTGALPIPSAATPENATENRSDWLPFTGLPSGYLMNLW